MNKKWIWIIALALGMTAIGIPFGVNGTVYGTGVNGNLQIGIVGLKLFYIIPLIEMTDVTPIVSFYMMAFVGNFMVVFALFPFIKKKLGKQ